MTFSQFYRAVKQELQIEQLTEKQAQILMSKFYLKGNIDIEKAVEEMKK